MAFPEQQTKPDNTLMKHFLPPIDPGEALNRAKRTKKLLSLFNNPQDKIKVIHVAGTNGKGSVCNILAKLLTKARYKVGLFTNPYLINYHENIRIDQKNIPLEEISNLFLKLRYAADDHNFPCQPFDVLTCIAYIYFEQQEVDVAVIETGYGGRIASTNVVQKPVLSIITTLDLDHTIDLGSTIDEIAYVKAGIIKNEVPVLTLKNNLGLAVLVKEAKENDSELFLADDEQIRIEKEALYINDKKYKTPLLPLYQEKNIALVLKALEILATANFIVSENHISSVLATLRINGRFQYIKNKNCLIDCGHNPSGAREIMKSLDYYFPDKKRIWIYSLAKTKDYGSMSEIMFRQDDIAIWTEVVTVSDLATQKDIVIEHILKAKLGCQLYEAKNIPEALTIADSFMTDNQDYLCIVFGNPYLVRDYIVSELGGKGEQFIAYLDFMNILYRKANEIGSFRSVWL